MEPNYTKFDNDSEILVNTQDVDLNPETSGSSRQENDGKSPSLLGESVEDKKRRIRLRAVETEVDFFLRLVNGAVLKRLVLSQAAASLSILVCQIILLAISGIRYYKVVDASGIGIWGPLTIFSIAPGLSYMAIKSPTGCLLGTAMGFQITSAIVGSTLAFLAAISITFHSKYTFNPETMGYDQQPDVGGRLFCSLLLFSSVIFVLTCIFISIQFCRTTCCGRYKATQDLLFDVETVKP